MIINENESRIESVEEKKREAAERIKILEE